MFSETMAWAAAVAPDGTFNTHVLTATSGIASTIAAPTSLIPGNRHLFVIANGSGGVMGAITWNAAYVMTTFAAPANGETIAIEFEVLANGTQLRQVAPQAGGSGNVQGVVVPAWVPAGITINNVLGNVFSIVGATAVAYTINAPAVNNPGQRITLRLENASGGVMGGATFAAAYVLVNGQVSTIPNLAVAYLEFICLGTTWLECGRSIQIATSALAPAWGAALAIDNTLANLVLITATSGIASTVGAPSVTRIGDRLALQFLNSSGGVLGVISFNAAYTLLGQAIAPIENGNRFAITFECVAAGSWVEVSRTYTNTVGLNVTTVVLTNAQVLALPTTPVDIVPAPGAGRMNILLAGQLLLDWTANYANIAATAEVFFSAGSVGSVSLWNGDGEVNDLLAGGADTGSVIVGNVEGGTTFANRAIQIAAANPALGNFTGGNAANTLTVRVVWTTLPST